MLDAAANFYGRVLSILILASCRVCSAQAPTINANGVTNGASFLPGIASGSWITIKGINLSTSTRTWEPADFKGNALPLTLDGVSVKVNNRDAPVYFISPTQVNALVPSDSVTGSVSVTVTTLRGSSAPVNATMQLVAPGWFTFTQQGGVYPAAVHVDGTFVGPTTLFGSSASAAPAQPDETILLFGTGFGQVRPAAEPLTVFSGAALLNSTDLRVTVGGQPATVRFAGLVSNGLYQFNIVVPNLPDGDHNLVATVAGVSTQTLRLAVRTPPTVPTITSITPSVFYPDRVVAYSPDWVINGNGLASVSTITISPGDKISYFVPKNTAVSVNRLLSGLIIAPDAGLGTRTVTVTSPGGISNSMTLTIESPPLNAPIIANALVNSPRLDRGGGVFDQFYLFSGKLDYTDRDGDIGATSTVKLRVAFDTNVSRGGCNVTASSLQVSNGTISFSATKNVFTRISGDLEVYVSLVDRAGNESNTIVVKTTEWYCSL